MTSQTRLKPDVKDAEKTGNTKGSHVIYAALYIRSRYENPQKLTQLSPRTHSRRLVEQKDRIKRRHQTHPQRQPGEQLFPIQVVLIPKSASWFYYEILKSNFWCSFFISLECKLLGDTLTGFAGSKPSPLKLYIASAMVQLKPTATHATEHRKQQYKQKEQTTGITWNIYIFDF